MNKIYKVIWSKAKHTYVVASEIAKGHTKGETTGKGLKKLAAAMLVAAALLSPSFAWAQDMDVSGKLTAGSASVTNSISVGHNANVGGAVNAGSLNSRGNLNVDGNALVKGTLTSQSTINGKEIVSQTNITAKNKVVGMQGVVDNTLTSGNYVTAGNTVGENIVALDTQVKANADQTSTALHVSKDGNLIVGTKEKQTVKDMKIRGQLTSGRISTGDITSSGNVTVAGKMAADGVTDETTKDGTYIKQNNTVGKNLVSLDKQVKANADAVSELDTRITNVKEYVLSETNNNYVSKTDAAVEDGAIVKKANTIGQNVAQLDAALAKETATRLGADAAQDKVIKQVNDNLVASVNTINESVKTTNENMAAGFTALSQADANEVATREAKDTELNERITNEANAIHDEIKAGDTALDTRITNVKEYVLNETVSKTDAAVQDGAIVKAANTIGENVTNLDAALAKETAARIGADKAQDKVIQQVNQNMVEGFNTINKNMADGFTALNQADAKEAQERAAADAALDDKITAETSARVAADTKLVEATNGGLSLDNDNVLQKTKTEISSTGEVKTSKEAATTLIINKKADNQVKIDSEGVTVGTSSTQMDAEGFTAGGHDYDAAGAALMSDGRIKGANGDFTVDTKGNVTSTATVKGATLTDGKATISNGNIQTNGGEINTGSGAIKTVGGDILTAGGKLSTSGGDIVAGTGDISGHNITATGDIQGKSISDGTATMQNGNITGVKNLSAETITTSGNADIGGDLTVKGKLNVDEIDLTKNGIDDDYYVTSSTKVAAGEITAYKDAKSTKDGSEKESAIDYDEKGTSTWAKSTDADGNWNKSTLTVEGNDVTSKVVDSNGNKNESIQTASASNSSITGTVEGKNYKSYITQNLKNILQGIQNGTNESTVDQTETGIKSTATDGTKTASTNLSNGGFNTYATDGTNKTYTLQTAESLTSQIGDDGKVKSVMNADGITNNADGGTITNSAKDLVNTATGDITNTAKNGTITNDAKDLVNKATGDMTNTVGGKLLNDVTGDMENKVGGKLTTTVTGKTTENYNGGLETTVTGDETHTVNGSQTNEITGSQNNTIGGNQTTTVTGDSSLTAENISNEAKNKITNKALDVETDASSSIVNKVANDAGSNTSTQLSYQTTEKMSQTDGKTASYLRGAAEEKSQLTDGAKKTTIDTVAGQTNTNITDGTNTSNNLQNADKIASSVTDGKSTTVVDQKAGSLASSITDGTKANNTNNTVDKSEQLIKASDTQYSATTKTAAKMEDALVSGSSVIDVIKSLDDAANPLISSVVTDGTNNTSVAQTAKDITNTAKNGTITNDAKDLVNTASNSITDKVGGNVERTMGTKKIEESVKDAEGNSNTATKTADKDINVVTDGTNTSTESQLADSVNTSLKVVDAEGKTTQSLSNVKTVSDDTTKITDTTKNAFSSSSQKADSITTTVKDTKTGTISERSQTVTQVQDKVGTTTVTTTEGLTKLTNEAGTHNTQMDFAEVLKDLGVRGNATVDGTSTLKGDVTMESNASVGKNLTVKGDSSMEGNASVGKDLTVAGKSTLTGDVTMENNATVKRNLTVEGETNLKNTKVDGTLDVTGKSTLKGSLEVTGGTTTDKLHVTSTSQFDGAATFKDIVTMEKDLNVGGNAKVAGDVTAKSFKVGENTYIDKDGINANGQVIKNVGKGDISNANSTDAVSGGQLYETNTRVSGLETRMGTVETKVDKLDNKIDKVGANAAAMANLHPLEFDEDSKWNIAAAVGSSGSETASAVGVFYRPNENVMVNASAAMGTGENMFGGGVSLRLGHGGNKAKDAQMKAAAKENRELRAKVDDLTARMDALLSVLNPNMSKDFPDVPENHWAYEAVSRLAGNGIVEGYEDGKYHGERQMTRYEMAEIIYNALSKGAKAEKKLVEEFRPELQAMAAQKKA